MAFDELPGFACWQHRGLRTGFEVTFFELESWGLRVTGTTTGLQDGDAWAVNYDVALDPDWSTRSARVVTRTTSGVAEMFLETDGAGHWRIDGVVASQLDGCRDVDLEASALTNALPIHRLALSVGERADAPAAYVRVAPSGVARLDQLYARLEDSEGHECYHYEAPVFDFTCRLVYDGAGLVLDYPGIAVRAG